MPILLFAALLSATPSAETIVFLGLKPQSGVDEGTANSISELVLTELYQHTQVISNSDVKSLLDQEAKKELMGCDQESCLAEVGLALGATYIIDGTIGMVGKRAVLTLKLINTREVKTAGRSRAIADSVGDLVGKEVQAVRELLGVGALAAADVVEEAPAVVTKTAVAPEPKRYQLSKVGWAGAITAGVGLLAGMGLGIAANSNASQARDIGTPTAAELDEFDGLTQRASAFAIGTDVAFTTAALGAALFVFDWMGIDSKDSMAKHVMIGPRSIAVAWRF